jgi:hypothetical protein
LYLHSYYKKWDFSESKITFDLRLFYFESTSKILFFLLPLLRGRDEPDDVLEGEPADEDGLANCEDEMLLVLTLFALKNKKCYLLSCFK